METSPTPTDLRELSLHQITEEYGEYGLYNRTLIEINNLPVDDETKQLVVYAADLARYAHDGQMRGPQPYSTHVFRVATRIIHYFGIKNPDIICAALLHDSVEDRPEKLIGVYGRPKQETQEKALKSIARSFNNNVASLVAAVTNPDFNNSSSPTANKNKLYQHHVTNMMDSNPLARIIKLSDFIDNFAGLHYSESSSLAAALADKYRPLIPFMKQTADDPTTPLSPKARQYIISSLEKAEQRCDELFAVN